MDMGAPGDARYTRLGVPLSSVAATGVVRFPPTRPPDTDAPTTAIDETGGGGYDATTACDRDTAGDALVETSDTDRPESARRASRAVPVKDGPGDVRAGRSTAGVGKP